MRTRQFFNFVRIQGILTFALIAIAASGQDSKSDTGGDVKTCVENRKYVFLAEQAMPMKGGMVSLTPSYTFKVSGDTIVCDLPYYGRVYQSTYGSDGGLKFTSVDFDYKSEVKKKGGWDISIKTKDLSNNCQLRLTIFNDGSSSLNVTASDRQSISYRGKLQK